MLRGHTGGVMSEREWFFVRAGAQQGPVTREEVLEALSRLPPSTLVWKEGYAEWQPADQVSELAGVIRPAARAPMPPPRSSAPRAAVPADHRDEPRTLNPFVLWKRCFSWSGRFSRSEFAVAYLCNMLVSVVLGFVVGMASALLAQRHETLVIVLAGLLVLWIIPSIGIGLGSAVRRLHDLGHPTWYVVALLVPCVNTIMLVYLFAAPGKTTGASGSSAAVPVIVAVVVVVLLIVPVIGIVAAIAIPSLLRARISANEAAAIGDVRTAISAQAAYQSVNQGLYESRAECLSRPESCIPGYSGPTFLDPGMFGMPRHGYVEELHGGTPPASATPGTSPSSTSGYAVIAYPVSPNKTGVRAFCGDASGRLCHAVDNSKESLLERLAEEPGVRCAATCLDLR
jgi:uncharacterized membrane protein YhaH (DUF805 family)